MPRPHTIRTRFAAHCASAVCGVVLMVVVGTVGAGCGMFRIPEPPAAATPEAPQWVPDRLRDHLTLFADRTGEADRDAATARQMRGRARAAAYVAARFRESLVQPAFNTTYQQRYEAPPISLPLGSLSGSDSTGLLVGRDYMLDARSGTGRLDVREVLPLRATADSLVFAQVRGRTVLVQSRDVTDEFFRRLQDAGAASVWQVGTLTPGPLRGVAAEVAVVQVTTSAAANLLGLPIAALAGAFDEPEVRPLRAAVTLETVRRELPPVDALNVLGYITGQDPLRQSELVIVCADLDAREATPSARAAMGSSLGAAATLELARAYATFGEWTTTPERSILFAVWSGGAEGYAGLQAYLRQPLWTLQKTVRIVYVGLPEADRPTVEALAATAGVPLTIVPLPEGVVARYRSAASDAAASDSDRLLTAATSDALALLEQAHRAVLTHVNAPRITPPAPEGADSLRLPGTRR